MKSTDPPARWGRVTLHPQPQFTREQWRKLHSYFRDPVLADWNGATPTRLPEWLFRWMMLSEERGGERRGFGILDEEGTLIGSAELYSPSPPPPQTPKRATLGIMIGEKDRWNQGYGREAVAALLNWGFGAGLERVRLMTFGHNLRAQRAFLACGFREVGRERGAAYDEVYMEITAADWQRCAATPEEPTCES